MAHKTFDFAPYIVIDFCAASRRCEGAFSSICSQIPGYFSCLNQECPSLLNKIILLGIFMIYINILTMFNLHAWKEKWCVRGTVLPLTLLLLYIFLPPFAMFLYKIIKIGEPSIMQYYLPFINKFEKPYFYSKNL